MTGIARYCILAVALAAYPVLAADGPEPMNPKRLGLAMYPYLRGPLTEARVAEAKRAAGELASIRSAWGNAKTTSAQRAELKQRLGLLAATLKNVPAIRTNPYDAQINANLKLMKTAAEPRRIRAIEALGYLRAYRCAGEVARLMSDNSTSVRRQAAETLAWIGGRAEIPVLLKALGDLDWVVRQGACAALLNITAMELPLDALADKETQRKQIAAWRQWAKSLRPGLLPAELVKLAASDDFEDRLRAVRAAGSLGGTGAAKLVAKILRASEPDKTAARNLVNVFAPAASRDQTPFTIMQAGLRSLGRLRQPEGLPVLGEYLNKVQFARYAADGLGEYGGVKATRLLIEAADRYVPGLKGRFQRATDDVEWPANPLSTAFAIYSALLRLPVEGQDVTGLVEIAHGAVGQVRKQYDRGVFYKPEATRVVGRYVLEMTGLRRICVREVFKSLGVADKRDELLPAPDSIKRLAASYKDELLPGFCDPSDGPTLIKLLTHNSNRVRIMACKALIFADAKDAVDPIAKLLAASKPEADYGFVRDFLLDPHRDPSGRWRGTFARALGALGSDDQVPLLTKIMNDPRSVLDVRYAAARALADIDTPKAVAALKPAAKSHDFHNIRLLAREVLFRHGVAGEPIATPIPKSPAATSTQATTGLGPAVVFIKGDHIMPDYYLTDIWRQTYCLTDSGGPEYRVGDNLFVLRPARPGGKLTPLTKFKDGWVASCEVSYDGKRVLFTRRAEDNPWWQVFEIAADGSDLRQLTSGPYHHLNPNYLPDGRIVLATTRLGFRDEYHGQQCSALAVMNADGSDLHLIAANAGRDCEPTITPDGRVLFNRLDVFYNMTKAEMTIQSVFPDGTGNVTLYGPERRAFWAKKFGPKTENWYEHPHSWMHDRHRVVTITQPQPLTATGEIVACSGLGLIAFKTRFSERFCHKTDMALTTPFAIGDSSFLCAASERNSPYDRSRKQWYDSRIRPGDPKTVKRIELLDPTRVYSNKMQRYTHELLKKLKADLGLYVFDAKTAEFTLVYNDPATADFEARPLAPRKRPPIHPDKVARGTFTGRILCQSVFTSRQKRVARRAKWIRIIEGQPLVHKFMRNSDGRPRSSHNFDPELRNHQGTLGRVLGTAPLAADGSFALEVPADRLIQCQTLDADRQVVGNQIQWIYVRPGENRGCVGCHNTPDAAPIPKARPRAMLTAPIKILPIGGEFEYEARPWRRNDPIVLDSIEERLRTVLSLELLGRQ